jgi:hypothetical protein
VVAVPPSAVRGDVGAQFVSNIGSWMQTVAAQWLMLTLTSSATYVALAPALGSPYEDRLHGARGEQAWPGAGAGDIVVIMQIEIQPPRLDEALSLVEEVAAAQSADAAMSGQVLLQRRCRPSKPGTDLGLVVLGGVRGTSRLSADTDQSLDTDQSVTANQSVTRLTSQNTGGTDDTDTPAPTPPKAVPHDGWGSVDSRSHARRGRRNPARQAELA